MKKINKFGRFVSAAVVTMYCLGTVTIAVADSEDTTEAKIARAMSAGPASISAEATIMDVDGTILREGSNSWTCFPGVGLIPGDKHPMCNDPIWMGWMKAAGEGVPFVNDIIGVSYMLQGDAMVNNDNPSATDPDDGGVWVQEGPHIMLLLPTPKNLEGVSRDPFNGGHYVMWDKTPLVHVMVPVGDLPE